MTRTQLTLEATRCLLPTYLRTKILLRGLNLHPTFLRLGYKDIVLISLQEAQLSAGRMQSLKGPGRCIVGLLVPALVVVAGHSCRDKEVQNGIQYPPPGWVRLTFCSQQM